ncbi:hypothetical protein PHYBLDRAFT_167288 [Phycomyces blakesleeanus NRRL 1555(-)]|uniref:Reverse transcriptase zinc-binding domain-containing protein n=2 Tax=Phycomyces blakesleeanus TaxID=4837 RepID=A0A162XHR6_PHYB8|nr:hypothetical protein PHYBLDRAFT_167288 [Phycomyces blakesleeanus NRRL 1555(-)]OAD74955.1 hypothetical protein PHYBLDRAFT_167288 [Phycomyces blakesleeanus NRRL 1555(-)]|eukprot:XP_018292995.1 hypothetical protein PHYBLDRAFT_167288 [Phycomyces blakesleeanus NRRL 1555(-)]
MDIQNTFNMQFRTTSSVWSQHCGLVCLTPMISIVNPLTSVCGRCISATVEHANNNFSPFQICVVYAPATVGQRYKFLSALLANSLLLPTHPSRFILLGDFNHSYHTRSPRPRLAPHTWLQFLSDHLFDCVTMPDSTPMPTFHRGTTSSTLDYIFSSSDIFSHRILSSVDYIHPQWSDHFLVSASFLFDSGTVLGKGLWRANPRLSYNQHFCLQLDSHIHSLVHSLPTSLSVQEQWDSLKTDVIHFIRSYCRRLRRNLTTIEAHSIAQRDAFCSSLLTTIQSSCAIHLTRSLSIRGRATVLNTLILSRLWHVLRVISVPVSFLDKVKSAMGQFLQHRMFPPIKLSTLCLPLRSGGLGVLDPSIQQGCFRNIFSAIDRLSHDFSSLAPNIATCLALPLRSVCLPATSTTSFPPSWQHLRVEDAFLVDPSFDVLCRRAPADFPRNPLILRKFFKRVDSRDILLQPFLVRAFLPSHILQLNYPSIPSRSGSSINASPFVCGLLPGIPWSKLKPRMYRSLCSSSVSPPLSSTLSSSQWRIFWNLPIHHHVRNIWYRGLHHKLSSRSLLHRILPGPFPTDSCPICEASTDTPDHFLFSCPLKIDVWSTFWQDVFGSHPTLPILHDAFYNLSFPYTRPSDIHAASLFSCALLAIWRHHWSTVFDNTPFVSSTVLSTASRLVAIFKAEKSLDDLACSLAT